MEAKSEERAALRFHTKLKRLHHKGYYYNLEHQFFGWMTLYHLLAYCVETIAVEYHKRHIKNDWWSEKKPGIRIMGLGD